MTTLAEHLHEVRVARKAARAKKAPTMPPDLAAEGYRLHVGTPDDDEDLRGKFWWTLGRDGWTEYESGPTFKDYRAVVNSARKHCDKERARGADAWT